MPTTSTADQLTTQATSIAKVKYFPIELYCSGMLPNTTYDAYANATLINAFCRPYGGRLGSPLTSNSSGALVFQYLSSVQYAQQYVVNPPVSNNNLISSAITIHLVDPFNHSSTINIPLVLKSGSQ